jgi:hypothetical protein
VVARGLTATYVDTGHLNLLLAQNTTTRAVNVYSLCKHVDRHLAQQLSQLIKNVANAEGSFHTGRPQERLQTAIQCFITLLVSRIPDWLVFHTLHYAAVTQALPERRRQVREV